MLTARTVARIEHGARLRAIAIEAAEQCGRLGVPEVAAPLELADWLAEAAPQGPILLADAGGGGIPILAALPAAAVLVGPEGGLTPEETARLRADPRVRHGEPGPAHAARRDRGRRGTRGLGGWAAAG